MSQRRRFWAAPLVACGVVPLVFLVSASWAAAEDSPAITPEQEQFFEQHVRPILANRCLKCHGAEKQESGLRLDSRTAVLAGGDAGEAAAVPGEPDKSLLIRAVRHEGDYHMPPKEKLPDAEIETLTAWVKGGLPWPAAHEVKALTFEERLAEARANHWSLQPIVAPQTPPVTAKDWPQRKMDYFILARLEEKKLAPSPQVDRRTLIRRVTFDLHGLPPTPEEVEAFVNDSDADAYPKLIERLLSSPRYGERWGRHWLDVARYADTSGYAFQRERRYPYAYTYRDYVIDAFNNDLPYDQFLLEQLAADKLPSRDENKHLAALGFLTVGRKFNNRPLDIDDQIDAVTRGLMGMTVACARCHDHKYDAIPQEDYYSLYGVFASSNPPGELPLIGKPEESEAYKKFQEELEKRRAALNQYLDQCYGQIVAEAREKAGEYLAQVATSERRERRRGGGASSLGRNELKPRIVDRWREHLEKHAKSDHALLGFWHDALALDKNGEPSWSERAAPIIDAWLAKPEGTAAGQIDSRLKELLASERPTSREEVAKLYGKLLSEALAAWKEAGANDEATGKLSESQRQAVQLLVGADSPPTFPRDQIDQFLARDQRNHRAELQRKIDEHQVNDPGAPPRAMIVTDTGAPVEPRVFLRGDANRPGKQVPRQFLAILSGPERKPFTDGSGRLELARAIVAPENPLTARVIANRVWMLHFSEPLVDTPGDFGARSERPVQSELLDHLASYLRDNKWSLKELHREIMLSATYQQASEHRADAAEVDPENRLYWKQNRRRLEFEALRDSLLAVAGTLDSTMGGRPVEIARAASNRRTVYGFIDRQDLPNLFRVFDVASPDQANDRRARTTVPQQALYLMNSPFAIDQARALAARPEVANVESPAEKIAALYRLLFQRSPTAEEVAVGEQYIQSAAGDAQLTPWEQYAHLLLMTNEFAFVD